jgi:hypothetical protein
MNRIAVVIILFLSASLILAQNINEIDQNGSGHAAEVTQTGDNYSGIIQSFYNISNHYEHPLYYYSHDNTAIVIQNGANQSRIDQRPRTPFDSHDDLAEVSQTGSNISSITQMSPYLKAVVNQNGEGNESVIYQGGERNNGNSAETYLNQTGTNNKFLGDSRYAGASTQTHVEQIGEDNSAIASQIGGSILNLSQSGSRNQAVIKQRLDFDIPYKSGRADIIQLGNDNTAIVSQENDLDNIENEARITQTGSYNYAEQTQGILWDKTAKYQLAEIIQTGSGNYASQKQESGLKTNRNEAYILQMQDNARAVQYQMGEYNYAEIKQWAYVNPKYGDENSQSQIGDGNKAMAHTYGGENVGTQIQTGDDNWTYIKEAGSYNNYYVEQTGNGNAAFEETHGNTTAKYNELSIIQEGDDNQGYISVKGEHNTAKIYQEGNGNIAGTSQSDFGIMQEGANNYAESVQYGVFNVLNMIQEGDGNYSKTSQLWGHKASVNQFGNGNKSEVSQIGIIKGSDYRNSVLIEQQGNDNESFVLQDDYYSGSWARLLQTGDNNNANLTQKATLGYAPITQTGDNNKASINQFGYQTVAAILQTGNYNTSQQDQLGPLGNKAYSTQIGNNNYALIFQPYIYCTAFQVQEGNDNYAEIKQYDYAAYSSGDNNLQIQTGNGNKAMAHSYGGFNAATQIQTGDNNWTYIKEAGAFITFYVEQTGNGNAAFEQTVGDIFSKHKDISIIQNGDDNQGYISVEGEYNAAKIYQEGNGNIAGTSQSDFGIYQDGINNYAEINQYGDNNEAAISQVGNNLTAVVNQSN